MIVDIFNIGSKYNLILADPPWKQSKGGKKSVRKNSSGKPLDYPVCTLEEIKRHLQTATAITEENSVLFLWTIDKYLIEAQTIAEELGYKLHARMIWNKVTGIPAAFTVRYGHEYLLYMYKGKLRPVALEERGKIHTVFTEQVKRHSQKPEISFEIIERLYPREKKLEMYARCQRTNWDCWGNDASLPKPRQRWRGWRRGAQMIKGNWDVVDVYNCPGIMWKCSNCNFTTNYPTDICESCGAIMKEETK